MRRGDRKRILVQPRSARGGTCGTFPPDLCLPAVIVCIVLSNFRAGAQPSDPQRSD